jgi:hypothetical protein
MNKLFRNDKTHLCLNSKNLLFALLEFINKEKFLFKLRLKIVQQGNNILFYELLYMCELFYRKTKR